MTSKKQLRQQFIAQRQAMSTVTWRQKSDAICRYLLDSAIIQAARTILAYVSIRQEPDLMPLLRSLGDRPSPPIVGLPRCQGKSLIWHQWPPHDPTALQPGSYGIPEPRADLAELDASSLKSQDVILVPAVGCDRHGYRLGYGGGFYDRLLSQSPWNTMTTIGIIFDSAYVDQLPRESWDLPLTTLCTESGFQDRLP